MSKKVLVIYYSQSGQLSDILNSLIGPLKEAGHTVEIIRVQPAKAYPFPWKGKSFFAVMAASSSTICWLKAAWNTFII